MSSWIPLLVRAEDFNEFATIVAQREADRDDGGPFGVTTTATSDPQGVSPVRSDRGDLAALLAAHPSWPEELLRRLANGTTVTAQRWVRALDVAAATDDQVWFTTSEIAEKSGMTVNEWRDAPRKFPSHLKAHYPDVPRTSDGRPAWPLLARSITSAEVSWAMTPETKASWRRIRDL